MRLEAWEQWEQRCLNRLLTGRDAVLRDDLPSAEDELSLALYAGLRVCRTCAQVQTVFEAARYLAPYLERHNPYRAADGQYTNGPHKTKAYEAVRREKIEALKEWARTNPNEYGYAVSRDTGEVVKEKEGTPENIIFSPNDVVGHRDVAVIHSHPNVVALSPGDWRVLVDTPNFAEVTAVNTEYTATAIKPPFWRKPRDSSVSNDVAGEWKRIFREVAHPYFTGERSLDEMDSAEESRITIEVNKQMAKKYRIVFHTTPYVK